MSTTQEEAAEAQEHPLQTLRTSATIYFGLLATSFVVYECARRRFHKVYDPLGQSCPDFHPPPSSAFDRHRLDKKLFGWIPVAFRIPQDEILDRCGLDTLTFVRFLRLGQKVSAAAILLSAVLFPLYATAPSTSSKDKESDSILTKLSMSNLKKGDDRLWASAIAAWIVVAYAMHLLRQEYVQYVDTRHRLLGLMEPAQYSVLISDLPVHLRTKETLTAYLRRLFPSSLRCVYVAINCSKLDKLLKHREGVRNHLEHALAEWDVTGRRPRHVKDRLRPDGAAKALCDCLSRTDEHKVDTIDTFQTELDKLNDQVERETALLKEAQSRLASQLEDREAGDEARSWRDFTTEEEQRVLHPIRLMRRAAFVSFTSLRSAQIALQTIQAKEPACMGMMPAPAPSDVDWSNVGLHQRVRTAGTLVSYGVTGAIVLFWTIPTAFVASLSTVESLRKALPFLDGAITKFPVLQQVFQQLAPLILVAFGSLAPMIFAFLSQKEGQVSYTQVHASLFVKLSYFQLIQTFFVTVVVGTVLDSLKQILDQPKTIVSMLGKNMPQQSTFFMSYVIILTGLSLSLELLRVVPLVSSVLFRLLAPRHTRREREAAWCGLRDITQTPPFNPSALLAGTFLVFLVNMTFASIAPLVCYFCFLYFSISELVYRRQIMFVYRPTRYAMGAYWPKLFFFSVLAMVVAQITLVGLLSLKKAVAPLIMITVSIAATLLFHRLTSVSFRSAAKFLPLRDCVELDEKRDELYKQDPGVFDFLNQVYRQPALTQTQRLRPDYRVLSSTLEEGTGLVSLERESEDDDRLFEQ